MDKSLLLGFITREGSSNSHTAILARSMNIPPSSSARTSRTTGTARWRSWTATMPVSTLTPPRPAQEPEEAPTGRPEKAGPAAGAEGQAQHHAGR
ncbi:MAG: PEP-utilizing enzyme [Faecalibacterium prausnitzii]